MEVHTHDSSDSGWAPIAVVLAILVVALLAGYFLWYAPANIQANPSPPVTINTPAPVTSPPNNTIVVPTPGPSGTPGPAGPPGALAHREHRDRPEPLAHREHQDRPEHRDRRVIQEAATTTAVAANNLYC